MVKYQPQLTIGKLEHKLRNFLLTRKLPCLKPSYFEVSGQAIFGLANQLGWHASGNYNMLQP